MLDINLEGAWIVARRVIPLMIERRAGVIINNSSIAGLRGMARLSHYAASKWGLVGLTKSWALELAPYNIRVVSIHATGVNTPMNDGLAALEGADPPTNRGTLRRKSAAGALDRTRRRRPSRPLFGLRPRPLRDRLAIHDRRGALNPLRRRPAPDGRNLPQTHALVLRTEENSPRTRLLKGRRLKAAILAPCP